jgi:predicted CopG family antitoxin
VKYKKRKLKKNKKGNISLSDVLYIQGVSRGIVNILGGGSMDYSE